MLGNVYITVFAFFSECLELYYNSKHCSEYGDRVIMKIILMFFKLTLKKNIFHYIYVILSTVTVLSFIKVIFNFMDRLINDIYLNQKYGNIHYKMSGIRLLFTLLGFAIIIALYYYVMTSNCEDYRIMKILGATRQHIRRLIFIQNLIMGIVIIPISLFLENKVTSLALIKLFGTEQYHSNSLNNKQISIAVVILLIGFIIIHGLIIVRRIKRTYPIQIGGGMQSKKGRLFLWH